jgi:hypothetical protein
MGTRDQFLCTLAAHAVEVITLRGADGKVVSMLHGGRLDGERFVGEGDAADQHERACRLARLAAWPLGRRRRR